VILVEGRVDREAEQASAIARPDVVERDRRPRLQHAFRNHPDFAASFGDEHAAIRRDRQIGGFIQTGADGLQSQTVGGLDAFVESRLDRRGRAGGRRRADN
jgi:hypothetical protein